MGIKFRFMFGSAPFINYAAATVISIIAASQTFGIGITIGGLPPPPPPPGYLKVVIQGPTNISSAVQWNISGTQNDHFSSWYNNGDTVGGDSGYNYYITFRQIPGWITPSSQSLGVPAYATNIFSASYSFVSVGGDYQGLFSEASGPKYESCGLCEVSGGKNLSFTARISSEGHRYSFSGKFDGNGNAWGTIRRSGESPLSVHLVAGENIITGEISNETWTAAILAKRNTFDSKINPTLQAGKYTFAFLGATNSVNQPAGDSFGTITVDRSGAISLAATLSDGTKVSQKTILSKDGTWPFYIPLYSGKGIAFGWLRLLSPIDSEVSTTTVFELCNYYGEYFQFPLGDCNYSGLPLTLQNDNVTWSVKPAYGQVVTLYTNEYCNGIGLTTTTNDLCVDVGRLHSVRVEINHQISPDFGTVTWMKPAQIRTKCYPSGFTNQMQAFVSTYQTTNQALALGYNTGQAVFQNGSLVQSISNEFSVDSTNKTSGTEMLNLAITPSSGLFKGSLTNPSNGKAILFNGVVLQKQHFSRGFFLDENQSGNVFFGP